MVFEKKLVNLVTLLVFLTSIASNASAAETPLGFRATISQSIKQPQGSTDPAQELLPLQTSPKEHAQPNSSGSPSTTSIERRRLRFESAERHKLRGEAKDINRSLEAMPRFEEYPIFPFWGDNYGYDCDPAFCNL